LSHVRQMVLSLERELRARKKKKNENNSRWTDDFNVKKKAISSKQKT
jgi:hypothetical protein